MAECTGNDTQAVIDRGLHNSNDECESPTTWFQVCEYFDEGLVKQCRSSMNIRTARTNPFPCNVLVVLLSNIKRLLYLSRYPPLQRQHCRRLGIN